MRPYILRRLKTDKRVIADLPGQDRGEGLLRPEQAAGGPVPAGRATTWPSSCEPPTASSGAGVVLAQLMRLKQICNHPAQVAGHGDYDRRPQRQVPPAGGARARRSPPRQEKVLVFTQFREIAEPLAELPRRRVRPARAGAARRHGRQEAAGAGRAVPARGRPAVLRAVAQGRRHRAEPDGGVARDPLRPLVEPGRREPGDRPRLPHRPEEERAGPQVRLPRARSRSGSTR